MISNLKFYVMCLSLFSVLLFNSDKIVIAQETSLGLEEIIVTARKREESLLDIPETV